MGTPIGELVAKLSLDSNGFNAGLDSAKKLLEGMLPIIGAVGVAIASIEVVKMGAEFQKATQLLQSNLDLTNKDLEITRKAILETMSVSPADYKSLIEAYRTVGSEGFNTAQSIEIVNYANKVAIATGDEAGSVANALSTALHDFGGSAQDAGKYMGYLHEAMVQGKATMPELTSVLGPLSAKAHAYGVSLKDVLAFESSLTVQGESAQAAATYIADAMDAIASPHRKAKDAVVALSHATGIDLVNDFSKEGLASKGLVGVLNDIMKATGGNVSKIRELFPNMQSFKAILEETGDKGEYLNKILGQMDNGQEALKKSIDSSQQTFDYKFGTFMNKLKVLGVKIGTALLPIASQIVDGLTNIGEWIGNTLIPKLLIFKDSLVIVFENSWRTISKIWSNLEKAFASFINSSPVQGFIKIVGDTLVNINKNFIKSLSQIWESIQKNLIPALAMCWDALLPIREALAKIIPIVLGVAGVIMGFLIIAFLKIIEVLSTVLGPVVSFIINVFSFVLPIAIQVLVQSFRVMYSVVSMVIQGVISVVVWLWNTVSKSFSDGWNFISGIIRGMSNVISSVFSFIVSTISNSVNNIWNVISTVWNRISDFMGGIINGIRNIGVGIFDGAINGIKGGINIIIGLLDQAIRSINSTVIDSLNALNIGGVGVNIGHIGEIPKFAKGTDFVPRDMLAIIHRGEAIIPASQNNGGGANNNSRNVHIDKIENHFSSEIDSHSFAQYLGFQLRTL